MHARNIAIQVAALANAIACEMSDDELVFTAAVLTQLADTLNTISVQRSLCKDKNDDAQGTNASTGSKKRDG